MMTNRRGVGIIIASLAWVAVSSSGVFAENWSRFRGPDGQGISDAKGIPTVWSEQDYNWRITLPGSGHSSPVTWGEKVFITSADERAGRGFLLCLNPSNGAERWRREWDLSKYPLNSLNSFASSTPVADEDGVYVLWPAKDKTVLVALTLQGHERWTVELAGAHARHGKGSSLISVGKNIIVSHEQEPNNEGAMSRWLAIDRRTRHIIWHRTEAPVANASYSTPCVYQDKNGQDQLVFVSNAHGITGVDPNTGDTIWEAASVLPDRVVSSPVIAGTKIFATCGQGGRGQAMVAIEPKRVDQRYQAEIIYTLHDGKVVPYVPTSVVHDGLLFAFHDSGQISCLQCDTGQVLWSEKPAGRFYGSPICVNGVLYAITTKGEVVVLKADSTYTLLAVNSLGQGSHATPAVADGRLYLRTESQMISIGSKEP